MNTDGNNKAGMGKGRTPAIHPGAFSRKLGKFQGMSKRQEVEDKDVRIGSTGGGLTQGTSSLHTSKLQGPRISHINRGATVATTMLAGLATNQSKTGPIFQQPNFKSRARSLGRPLGYGTVYKFI